MKICWFILWLIMLIVIDTWHLPVYMMHFWLKINIKFSQWSYTEMSCHTSNTSIANEKSVHLNWSFFFVISFQNLSFSKVQLWHLILCREWARLRLSCPTGSCCLALLTPPRGYPGNSYGMARISDSSPHLLKDIWGNNHINL